MIHIYTYIVFIYLCLNIYIYINNIPINMSKILYMYIISRVCRHKRAEILCRGAPRNWESETSRAAEVSQVIGSSKLSKCQARTNPLACLHETVTNCSRLIRFSLVEGVASNYPSDFMHMAFTLLLISGETNNDKEHPHFGKPPPADEYDAIVPTMQTEVRNC